MFLIQIQKIILFFLKNSSKYIDMEQNIILWLQSIGNSFLDIFFTIESYMASWIGALCLFLIIFFLVDKKYGLFYGCSFVLTIILNYIVKSIIQRPRPFVDNPEIVNKLNTIGYSMPSGHSVSITFMALSLVFLFVYLNKNGKLNVWNRTWFKIVSIICALLFVFVTAISRMYLGQHYISDILVGIALSVIMFFIARLLFPSFSKFYDERINKKKTNS